jgi:tetratricopeptide (TPR) repeat protein
MTRPVASAPFLGTFGLTFLAIAALFVVDTFLAKMDRTESDVQAARLFQEGQSLILRGNNTQAIDRLSDALEIERGNRDYLRTLAEAQLAAGKMSYAQTTLSDLLASDSADGQASLLMGRVLAKEGKFDESISYYHRAVYGHWKQNEQENRRRARLELIDLLAQQKSRQELLAELLVAQENAPKDVASRMRIGELFLQAGSPTRAASLFRDILHDEPNNGGAYRGAGDAEFAQGNYREAAKDFQNAIRLAPDDTQARHQLYVSNEIMALDPTPRELNADEHFRRSLKLVEIASSDISECLRQDPSPELQKLLGQADAAQKAHVNAAHERELSEGNLELAEKIWQAGKKECKAPPAADSPLSLVLTKLAQ